MASLVSVKVRKSSAVTSLSSLAVRMSSWPSNTAGMLVNVYSRSVYAGFPVVSTSFWYFLPLLTSILVISADGAGVGVGSLGWGVRVGSGAGVSVAVGVGVLRGPREVGSGVGVGVTGGMG